MLRKDLPVKSRPSAAVPSGPSTITVWANPIIAAVRSRQNPETIPIPVVTTDPFWEYVVLSCPFDGANNSTVFTDVKGLNTLTGFGDAKITTDDKKLGNSSLLIPNATSYVACPHTSDWTFPDNTICIEFCIKKNGNPVNNFSGILDKITSGVGGFGFDFSFGGDIGKIRFYTTITASSFPTIQSINNICDNQWHFIVGQCDGVTMELWVDGVSQGTVARGIASFNEPGTPLYISGDNISTLTTDFLMDDLRISRVARYSSVVPIPVNPFPTS